MTALMRVIAAAFAVGASAVTAGPSAAQTGYPTHPVRLIVPFAAGGPTDVIARVVAQKLSESWGQQVVTENVPGAGGNIGTAQAAKAAPDGYTLLVVSTGFIVNPSLYAKVPYDLFKDFAPITLIAASPNVLVVNPSLQARNVEELIALVKANPGKYSFAHPAIGSTPHLSGELFKLKFGLDLVVVPFTGAAPAITSTIGGHTPIAFTALPPALAAVKDGKLRMLGVATPQRSASAPDVATFAEQGIKDQDSDTLTGLVVPAATPKEIVDLLQKEIARRSRSRT